MDQKNPLIFDIARGSVVDGPGIRTVVFLKGCPLRCVWCQNPESQEPGPEIMFYPEYCLKCGNCEKGCDFLARRIVGKYYDPPELGKLLLRDRSFYETSNGGVTFSGGEPLLFINYIRAVAEILKREKIHLAVETCGYFDYRQFEREILPFVDFIFFDIKIIDPVKHQKYTGKSNELIFDNFEKLLTSGVKLVPRVPLVPDYTDTEENREQIEQFFRRFQVGNYYFLPYNSMGMEKRQRLGTK